MPEYVTDRIAELLNDERLAVNGSSVLILGVAYKKDVGDMRESPALDVIKLLAARGAAITYHDAHVGECTVEGTVYKNTDLSDETLASADLVVILTDHTAVDYDRVVAKASHVFDTRNATAGVTRGREKITKL